MSTQIPATSGQAGAPAIATQVVRAAEAESAKGRYLKGWSGTVLTILVVAIGLIWSIPTFGLFVASFRPAQLITTTGWWQGLVPPWSFTIQNYENVIQTAGMGQALINSLIISIPATIFPLLLGAFAAYAFAWMKFPGRDWIFFGVVALLVVPSQIALGPIYTIFSSIGLTGTYFAVWIAHTANGLPFAVFLLRNFFAGLPKDLMESAHIDGASTWRTFWTIVLPLSVPALASLAIFQFMWVWNDLLIALIFLGGSQSVAPITLAVADQVGTYGQNFQILTAAAFLSMALPLIVFFSMQRFFVRGILAGSVKG
jgi:alpha-glucoside transport system permease protein